MKKCVWVRPELVAQIEFLEWTDGDHLRHANFSGLRDDKDLAQAIGQAVIGQGYRVIYREAHILLEGRWKGDAISAREPSESGRASKA